MKLRDFGVDASREWLQQILQWSRNKISLKDNIDYNIVVADIGTTETIVGHKLGRIPEIIIPVAYYPYGTSNISFTKVSTIDKLFLIRAVAGKQALLLF